MALIISPATAVEADTLATVTARGSTTSTSVTLSGSPALTLSNATDSIIIGTSTPKITITGTQPVTAATAGVAIAITAGQGSSSTASGVGGAVTITGGASGTNSTGSGGGGAVTITGGIGHTINSTGIPGAITISAGAAQVAGQSGADVSISASNGFGAPTNANGGNVNITAGTGTVTAANGRIILTALGGSGGTAAAVVMNVNSANGQIIWQRSGTEQLKLTSAGLIPSVTNNIALGSSSLLWSNVYSTASNASYIGVNNTIGSNGYGISLYNGASAGVPTYGLMFQQTASFGTHGSVIADWATYFTMDNTSNRGWIFRNVTSGNVASINNFGSATFNGTVTASSDIRLKTDILVIDNPIEKINQLRGITYTRIDSGERHTGVIAQELLKVLPEAVTGSEDTSYAVAYGNIAGLLIEAIKEQQRTIDTQEQRIANLEKIINNMMG